MKCKLPFFVLYNFKKETNETASFNLGDCFRNVNLDT